MCHCFVCSCCELEVCSVSWQMRKGKRGRKREQMFSPGSAPGLDSPSEIASRSAGRGRGATATGQTHNCELEFQFDFPLLNDFELPRDVRVFAGQPQRTDRTHLTHVKPVASSSTAMSALTLFTVFTPHAAHPGHRGARRAIRLLTYRDQAPRRRRAVAHTRQVLLPALGIPTSGRVATAYTLCRNRRGTRRRFRSAAARAHLIALVVSLACHRRPVRGSYAHAVQRNPEREPANLDRMLAHRHVGVASLDSQTPHPRCCVA